MSYNDKRWMLAGFRVRHRYARGRGKTKTCELCGTKRRHESGGWKYKPGHYSDWTSNNPPCVKKATP